MARYRTHTVEFKRQAVGEHLNGGTSLNQLARRHDLSRASCRGSGRASMMRARSRATARARRTGAPTGRRSPAWSARSASSLAGPH